MKIPQYEIDGMGGEFTITQDLEKAIAIFLGVKHCIIVNSGTAAIFLALRATGAKKVAIPVLTMIATATAAELAGCELYFISNNEIPENVDTYVHVSLNGRDCGIEEVIKAYPHLKIVEDACQSFGSKNNGKYLGTFGSVGCFSFSPHKIISAGNGGCVVTNDDDIARNVKKLKNFGRESGGADQHDSIGYNFKFTDIQAGFLIPQFYEIASRIEKKKKMYKRYNNALSKMMRSHTGTPWFVDVYIDNREQFMEYLASKGIGTRKMYPLVTWQKPFAHYKVQGDSTQDDFYSKQGVWLPSSLNLTDDKIDYIIEAIQGSK